MDLTPLKRALDQHRTVEVIGNSGAGLTTLTAQAHNEWPGAAVVQQDATAHVSYPVSYTHLTLPTIYSV